jgi:hypothetical protein
MGNQHTILPIMLPNGQGAIDFLGQIGNRSAKEEKIKTHLPRPQSIAQCGHLFPIIGPQNYAAQFRIKGVDAPRFRTGKGPIGRPIEGKITPVGKGSFDHWSEEDHRFLKKNSIPIIALAHKGQ